MICAHSFFSLIVNFPVDHHIALSGGPAKVLVDWGHRTTLNSSPDSSAYHRMGAVIQC